MKKLLTLAALSCCFHLSAQRYLVNEEWSISVSGTYFYEKVKVLTDANNNVYTLGSTMTAAQGYDWILSKTSDKGDSLWTVQFDGDASLDDIAIDMMLSSSNEIYVVGGSWSNATDSLDGCVVKFDDSGNFIWRRYMAGASGGNDLYVSVVEDPVGNVYAGGITATALQGQNFLLSRYSSAGTNAYHSEFDHASLHDIAVKMLYDDTKDYLVLCGGGQTGAYTWDYCVAEFDTSGVLANSYNNPAGNLALHTIRDAEVVNGNIYLTGSVNNLGSGEDILTLKLDDSLHVVWSNVFDGPDGLADAGSGICVNDAGEVFITGNSGRANFTKDIVVMKIDTNGATVWTQVLNGAADGDDAGKDIEANNGYAYVTGNMTMPGNSLQFYTACFNDTGKIVWEKISASGADVSMDLAIDTNGDIVIGASFYSVVLYTEKYAILEHTQTTVLDTNSVPVCIGNQLIIKFNPAVVKTAAVDERGKKFGKINEFIADSTVLKMSTVLGFDLTKHPDVNLIKIYSNLTTSDTISISLLGDTVRIPQFWTSFVMTIPDTVDLFETIDLLDTLRRDIRYAEPDALAHLMDVPNDGQWGNQENLYSTAYPNGHINVEPAWDYETGKDFVKVGVYDTGIDWDHDDFSTDGSNAFAKSKVIYGYDYFSDVNYNSGSTSPDYSGHGTRVAGIIGAIRDNNTGIAGIAGGNNTAGSGCNLYSIQVTNGTGLIPMSVAVEAVFDGASYNAATNLPGLGLNITNHSYGWNENAFYGMNIGWYHEVRAAYYYAWRHGVTQVTARGNSTSTTDPQGAVYPACLQDDWVISVGASGTDGEKKDENNGEIGNNQDSYVSIVGLDMDVLAPGTTELIKTTTNNNTTGYTSFNGTSAAAPHVAGLAALMMSYYNAPVAGFQNLVTDDIEFLIQKYAVDQSVSGYDAETGHGLIDAGAVLEMLDKDQYKILHLQGNDPVSAPTSMLVDGNYLVQMDEEELLGGGGYMTKVHSVTATFNHTLPAGATIIDAWPLRSHSVGMPLSSTFTPSKPGWVEIVSISNTQAVLRTYVYEVTDYLEDPYPFGPGFWYPFPASATRFPYAIHFQDPTVGAADLPQPEWNVYPNPAKTVVTVINPEASAADYELTDVTGRTMTSGRLLPGENSIDVSGLPPASYFIRIFTDGTTVSRPVIKIE